MKKYKVEVIRNLFSEKIKEKDIDTQLANSLELYINKNYKSGWDLISLESLTFEVKTSFLRKREKIKKNIAIFTRVENFHSEEKKEKMIEPNIPLGPAIKKM